MDPFTNQPYAFDDHRASADPREIEFNNGIREITVSFSRKQKRNSKKINFHST
jgi:hypothetical protein